MLPEPADHILRHQSRSVEILIDSEALAHNLSRVNTLAPQSKILAMIKADGYGHGAITCARALSGADAFGVACLSECLRLRKQGITQPLVLLGGMFEANQLELMVEHAIDLVVHHEQQVQALEASRLKTPVRVWLKIDTGMHRLGFLPDAVESIYSRLRACESVDPDMVFMTHFSHTDSPDCAYTQAQVKAFHDTVGIWPGARSLAHSAAILQWPSVHADWVRPGLMLYGVSPVAERTGTEFNLKPVMQVQTQLMAIRHLAKGDRIGYGGTWICPEAMPVGVIPIGYGDGYPRAAVNGTPVWVRDRIVRLVGRVSMDMITVDLRDLPNPKVGDPVVLWGAQAPIENVALAAQTIPYELFCRLCYTAPAL